MTIAELVLNNDRSEIYVEANNQCIKSFSRNDDEVIYCFSDGSKLADNGFYWAIVE